MTEKAEAETLPILCEATGKLLARMDGQGIYLWCKLCHKEHRITLTGAATSAAKWQETQEHLLLPQR